MRWITDFVAPMRRVPALPHFLPESRLRTSHPALTGLNYNRAFGKDAQSMSDSRIPRPENERWVHTLDRRDLFRQMTALAAGAMVGSFRRAEAHQPSSTHWAHAFGVRRTFCIKKRLRVLHLPLGFAFDAVGFH